MDFRLRQRWLDLSPVRRGNLVEWVTNQIICGVCTKGSVALDIGANYGAHTFTMLQQVGASGRVVAYEANPEVAQQLCAWKASHPNLDVVELALSDCSGDATFFVCENAGFSSLDRNAIALHGLEPSKEIRVKVDTLDASLPRLSLASLDLVKIDVEGAELAVLQGGLSTWAAFKPTLVIEMSAATIQRESPQRFRQFETTILSGHYAMLSIFGEIVGTNPRPEDYQFLFVPASDGLAINRVGQLARQACIRFFEEGLLDWNPYQKFQAK